MTNYQEYLAGTRPNDPPSALRLAITDITDETVVLRFEAVAGRSYTVLVAPNLAAAGWLWLKNIPAGTETREVMVADSEAGRASRFYRAARASAPLPLRSARPHLTHKHLAATPRLS